VSDTGVPAPRDLRPLFAPRSVAVVGASADPSKWGNVLARGALRGSHRRSVFLVNRAGGEILGVPTYASLGDLPDAPELAVIAVPAAAFEAAVDDALAVGARAMVAVTAGLGELDEAGRAVEAAVTERVRAAGAVLLGPNCLGVFDAEEELDLGWSALPSGSIALVSQSGNLALELARLAVASGLGFSRFASLGNQADLVAADLLGELAAHQWTDVIALYLEDFRDGRAVVEEATTATAGGTPVILLVGGVSPPSARAALSHTGALVSDRRAVEAACRAAGVVAARTPKRSDRCCPGARLRSPPARPTGRRIRRRRRTRRRGQRRSSGRRARGACPLGHDDGLAAHASALDRKRCQPRRLRRRR
jgi:acetate---CoA ligase (ADP-forming)